MVDNYNKSITDTFCQFKKKTFFKSRVCGAGSRVSYKFSGTGSKTTN